MRSWLGSKAKLKSSASTVSLNAVEVPEQIDDMMRCAAHIMNDDVQKAEEELSKGSSAFHKLGKGVVTFMRATMGFEQEVMKEAAGNIAEAEALASERHNPGHRAPHGFQSSIYPPGSEFGLCLAEAHLMGAVLGVMNESLTESIKGFYKLRKAYLILDGLLRAERDYVRQSGSMVSSATASVKSMSLEEKASMSQPHELEKSLEAKATNGNDSAGPADDRPKALERTDTDATLTPADSSGFVTPKEFPEPNTPASLSASIVPGADEGDIVPDNPVDTWIYSGSNLCFGILMLMLSLIPPTFATLLKIVGFKGDREAGLHMIWQASKFDNMNGAVAGLALFGYYNNMFGACDIVPQAGEGAIPRAKLNALLTRMRSVFPQSQMWLLEESRMVAGEKRPDEAISMLKSVATCPFRQVEALKFFESSLNMMFVHDYAGCTAGFEESINLNNWSHGMFYYIAGAAQVEAYRESKMSDPEKAMRHAQKANELLQLVQKNTGRKRMMARQLPLDVFVHRKIQKWEHRAKEWNIDFIDAVGVSPLEEMIYFWNGHRRMQPHHLEHSLARLDWSTSDENIAWKKESLDERAILAVLKATVLRQLDRTEESKALLMEQVIKHPKHDFKGPLKDNWTCPVAHYEMAANLWAESNGEDRLKMQECSRWLEDTARWESYELDARIGVKVSTGRDTLKRKGITAAVS